MVDIYIRNAHGQPQPVRMCRHCANPRIMYIAGRLKFNRVGIPRVLGLAFGLIVAILNIAFGYIIGGSAGLWVALVGILCGAGISVAFALSISMPQIES